jgi:hypothetical protein
MIVKSMRNWGVAVAVMAMVVAPTQAANAAAADPGSRPSFAEQALNAGLDQRQARLLQDEVDKVLAGMKVGGSQISANEVRSDDGRVKVVVPLPGEQRARPLSGAGTLAGCPYKHLCLYGEPNFDGPFYELYYCDFVNLGDYGVNDELESYNNNQTAGAWALFYNWENERGWVYKFDSTAPHSDYDLNRWPGLANMIDGVTPC